MSARLDISPHATADALEIADYYADNNPDVAHRFLTALEKTYDLLRISPHLGTAHNLNHKRYPTLRKLPANDFPTYIIYYQPLKTSNKGVRIVRVLHTARDHKPLISHFGKRF